MRLLLYNFVVTENFFSKCVACYKISLPLLVIIKFVCEAKMACVARQLPFF